MFSRSSKGLIVYLVTFLAALLVVSTPSLWAQHGTTGTVTVTVLDPSGSVVQGAQLELRDLTTNDVRKAETQDRGTYTFVNLSLGKYSLKVTKSGFRTQEFTDVVVQAAQTTDISATLKVGAISETVEVSGGTAPLVETTSNAIGTTVDLKQIEDLPLNGRDLTQLSNIVPGYTGTWDGLPSIAQGNNIDGVISSTSRMKFGGNAEPDVQPRLENIQEMTVQTEQLNLDQGFGQANMQLNFVTRRGSNAFHGRLYEDYQSSSLNANSWLNDSLTALNPSNPATKPLYHHNEFGGSLGGRIIKDKLFFFGTYSEAKTPGSYTALNYVFTSAAQTGTFTYTGTDSAVHTVNLFTLAANCNGNPLCSQGQTLPTTVDANTATILGAANSAAGAGHLSPSNLGDPNLQDLNWQVPNATTYYYPAVRVDYNASQKLRLNLAWNMTKSKLPGAAAPDFPGSAWAKTGAGNEFKYYTVGLGIDWTLSPTMVNEFRSGFLYHNEGYAYNAQPLSVNAPQLGWNYTGVPGPQNTMMSGTVFNTGIQTYYPTLNAADTMTWQHGAHTVNYGFSWWREQNHYYNPMLGYAGANYGLANGDPAQGAFTVGTGGTLPFTDASQTTTQSQAQQLYSILAGRIASAGGSYAFSPKQNVYAHAIGRYNLDELEKAWGLFFQDSYRIRTNLTINYGLRWDFTGADKDLSNLYHSASTTTIYGPSGVGNLFKPGSLTTDPNGLNPMLAQISQPYNNWNVSPQPALGIAWNPKSSGFLGKLMGGDQTVIRAGFSLRKFTEPQQYVWNEATDYASYYYQSFFLNPSCSTAPNCQEGSFVPGTLSIDGFNTSPPNGDPAQGQWLINNVPVPYGLAPAAYLKTEPVSDFTLLGGPSFAGPLNGLEAKIKQPYTESWNLGIQRQLGPSRALELRYVGSRTLRQWISTNTNEVNIFENGFLSQFKIAQQNLAINQANGITSFANNGLAGQQTAKVFDDAFAGEASGGTGVPMIDYAANNFITDLQTGAAGAMAATLAGISGNAPYLCNLVGASFAPCANNLRYTGAGAGYPINDFVANPYGVVPGSTTSTYVTAEGYSTYNALQVDFRQRQWHGLQFDANYTWSHTLGTASQNNWQGQGATFTLRDLRLSYGPTLFDLTHVVHMNGTYDLPFGKDKMFANHGGVLDRLVGGWTLGTIFSYQTGAPFLLFGGYSTFNDYGDGGVALNGVTPSQLQSAIGSYRIPGSSNVAFINPKYLLVKSGPNTGGGADPALVAPNTTPGIIGQRVWLHGPHNTYDDISITKHFPITERWRFSLQAEMLNAFNHPTFGPGATNGGANFGFNAIQSGGFGISNGTLNGARVIELRGNIEF